MLEHSISDNYLYSAYDLLPVTVNVDINTVHNNMAERSFITEIVWHKAIYDDIGNYKTRLDLPLSNMQYDKEARKCKYRICSAHKVYVINLCSDTIAAYINAAECIPTAAPSRTDSVPRNK